MKYSETIKAFLDLLEEARTRLPALEENLKREEHLTQDLLHSIELGHDYGKRCKDATQLAQNRRDRRVCKDAIEELNILVEYAEKNKAAVNNLKQTLGEMRKKEKYHEKRSYRPRVLKEER